MIHSEIFKGFSLFTFEAISFNGLTVDIERLWMADYAGQIPNRGLWLAILVQWL